MDASSPPSGLPVFDGVTRRALLARGVSAAGALAAGALLAACGGSGSSDKAAFGSTTTAARATSTTGATAATGAPSTTAAAAGAAAVTIAFSYAASDVGGRVRNPYIAVWVEDAGGALVSVVSVWYLARESKYLRELTEWSASSGGLSTAALNAVTGATRAAGQYQLGWDGKDLKGNALAGSYTLWIEAAREHGPHSVTSGPIVLGRAGTATLAANGELSQATVTVA